jgi:Plasmid encoded RepA protein
MKQRNKDANRSELVKVDDLLKDSPILKPLSPTQLRIIEAAESLDPQQILYQHTVFCQVCLPYRDPGNARMWERKNGTVHLKIYAGDAMDPERGELVEVGLPFGTKPRLILSDINTHAILDQSPNVDIEKSLTRFVRRMQLDLKGRNIKAVKETFTRLCAASMTIGLLHDGEGTTFSSKIMSEFSMKHFNVWLPKDERQRVLWPTYARLSHEYFESLLAHAVPLDEKAYVALSHSALAMDIYAWLAQRLHRIPKHVPALVTWKNLHMQFGWHYNRLDKFRAVFKVALKQVKAVYQDAKIVADARGLELRNSRPPVEKTQVLLP